MEINSFITDVVTQVELPQREWRDANILMLAQVGHPLTQTHDLHVLQHLRLTKVSFKPFIKPTPPSSYFRCDVIQFEIVLFVTSQDV